MVAACDALTVVARKLRNRTPARSGSPTSHRRARSCVPGQELFSRSLAGRGRATGATSGSPSRARRCRIQRHHITVSEGIAIAAHTGHMRPSRPHAGHRVNAALRTSRRTTPGGGRRDGARFRGDHSASATGPATPGAAWCGPVRSAVRSCCWGCCRPCSGARCGREPRGTSRASGSSTRRPRRAGPSSSCRGCCCTSSCCWRSWPVCSRVCSASWPRAITSPSRRWSPPRCCWPRSSRPCTTGTGTRRRSGCRWRRCSRSSESRRRCWCGSGGGSVPRAESVMPARPAWTWSRARSGGQARTSALMRTTGRGWRGGPKPWRCNRRTSGTASAGSATSTSCRPCATASGRCS